MSRVVWKAAAGAVVLAASLVGATACSVPSSPGATGSDGDGAAEALAWHPAGDVVVCDGTERDIGAVDGARPGEPIELTSAQPIPLETADADDTGRRELTWSCEPAEARLEWELTATGRESGRTVDLVLVGSADDPAEEAELAVTLFADSVDCDGIRHDVGVIENAAAEERIVFDADGSGINPGRADADGTLRFGWRCRPDDDGRVWEIEARGEESGREATFVLVGSVAPASEEPVEVVLADAALVCDGRVHTVAWLSNLVGGEEVTFAEAGAADEEVGGADEAGAQIRSGYADRGGNLEVKWQCGYRELDGADSRTWTLIATGTESGRSARVSFTGVADPEGSTLPPPATVELLEDPFVCDDVVRPVAEVGRLWPNEYVDFTSPDVDDLREGRAVGGAVTVRWQCDRTELERVGGTWTLTATGRESQRSVTFVITGIRTGTGTGAPGS